MSMYSMYLQLVCHVMCVFLSRFYKPKLVSPFSRTRCVFDIKVAICSNTSCLGWALPGVVMLGA